MNENFLLVKKISVFKFEENKWKSCEILIPNEINLKIFLNDKKFNILCSPIDIEELIIGFLFAENIISKYSDIEELIIDENNFKGIVKVNYKSKNNEFNEEKNYSNLKIKPKSIIRIMQEFQKKLKIYKLSGAVHASCLTTNEEIITIKEDIGRHNTFDKIAGECLKNNLKTDDKIIFTTGRISTEIIFKVSKLKIPIIVTMKTPSAKAIELAKKLNITVIGKVKDNSFVIFANKERIIQ